MFNPAAFRTNNSSIPLGNTEHPVMPHMTHHSLRPIPSRKDAYRGLFYVSLKKDTGVFTYRVDDGTLQYLNITMEELKSRVKNGEDLSSSYEIVKVPDSVSIGNAVLSYLYAEELI